MTRADADRRQAELNGLVDAFESAHAERPGVELTAFLPPADHPFYLEARRELVRVDLELSWLEGRRKHLPDYAATFPDLLQDRTAVQEIAFEEYRLRMLAGESPSTTEYEQQYGVSTAGWAPNKIATANADQETEADILLTFVQTLGKDDSWQTSRYGDVAQSMLMQDVQQSNSEAAFLLAQAMTALPAIGTTFLNFQLIAELGSGSFGRVYLARQGDLANRLVALKITIDLQGEEQKLAQLQHTNVVPIYSIHQAGPFHAVCMPYFGSTTLADLIRDLGSQSSSPTTGKEIVRSVRARMTESRAKLQQVEGQTHAHNEDSATLRMLEDASFVEAVLLIGERVTEGLIHAHERGILHRDLKPANILLTDDGQPMLLDFNLSADIKLHVGLGELQVGGTLPYMAPEHLDAMQGGKTPTDARSDLYALGVVLFELLCGRLPFETPTGPIKDIVPTMISGRKQAPPALRRWNPGVTPAVESLIRKCLQSNPDQRYQSAHHLHEDLKRQRQNRPLRYAPEPSIRERTQKWARRHPRLTSPAGLAALALLLLVAGSAPSAWQAWDQWRRERINEVNSAKKETRRAEQDVEAAQRKLVALDRLREFQQKSAGSSRAILETVCIMQALSEAWPYEENRLQEMTDACRQALSLYRVFDGPQWQTQPAMSDLEPGDRDRLLLKLSELLYALASAEQVHLVRLMDRAAQDAPIGFSLTLTGSGREVWNAWEAIIQRRLRTAHALNELARSCSVDSPARHLEIQKADLTQLQGDRKKAEQILARAQPISFHERTDERYWVAITLAGQDRYGEALALLNEATRQAPDHAGARLLRGLCEHNLGDGANAETSYNIYLNLRPDGVWGSYNRGLLLLAKKDWARAENDFDAVLKRHPDLAWAYAHRAAARQGRKKFTGAIGDLASAIRLGPEHPEFYFLRAQIHARVGNAELAELDRRRLLVHEPTRFMGWTYRGMARSSVDPRGAIADFDKALKLNPHSPLTLFHKARVLADALGCPTEAVEVLDKVLEQDPSFADARFQRGFLHAKLGKRSKAVADAEWLIKDEPTPLRHYQAAEIYATTAPKFREDAKRAIELLSFALRNGYGVQQYQNDPQLRSLANFVEFRRLAEGLKILGAGAAPRMRP
jgi:eukaryotic-like serine/threonine-protein kinase